MITIKTTLLITITIVIMLCFNACKKKCHDVNNPACENYDPCYDKTSVNASFKIYENLASEGILVEADTIWCNSALMLWVENRKNEYKDISVKWRVKSLGGFNQTYTDTLVKFGPAVPYLTMPPAATFYTVTCTITKNLGSCSNLKSIDSLSKVFYLWPRQFPNNNYNQNPTSTFIYLPIFGTYKGYKNSNPSQQIYVTLFDTVIQVPYFKPCEGITGSGGVKCNIIRNLAYNNYSSENTSYSNGNNFYVVGASGIVFGNDFTFAVFNPPCYSSKYYIGYRGVAWTDFYNSKKIYINYSFPDTLTQNLVKDFFTGYKVN